MSFFNNKYFDSSTLYALLFNKAALSKLNPVSRESVIRAQMAILDNQSMVTEIDNDMLCRVAESVYQNMLESERGKELLHKAKKYNIPYEMSRINWLKLIDDVHRYERLIDESEELGIDWKNICDPVYLEQEIEQARHQALNERNEMMADFFATRSLEV